MHNIQTQDDFWGVRLINSCLFEGITFICLSLDQIFSIIRSVFFLSNTRNDYHTCNN